MTRSRYEGMNADQARTIAYAAAPDVRTLVERDREALAEMERRGVLRRTCYLAGCDERAPGDSSFCSREHHAAYVALPEAVQHPRRYADLIARNDLDYTLSLRVGDAAASEMGEVAG
jgi:hypothetical protein